MLQSYVRTYANLDGKRKSSYYAKRPIDPMTQSDGLKGFKWNIAIATRFWAPSLATILSDEVSAKKAWLSFPSRGPQLHTS